MKSKVLVTLYDKIGCEEYGGKNQPIALVFEFEIDMALNAFYLKEFLRGYLHIGTTDLGRAWYSYVKDNEGEFRYCHKTNTFTGIAHIPTTDPDFIKKLITRGWKFKPMFLEKYVPDVLLT